MATAQPSRTPSDLRPTDRHLTHPEGRSHWLERGVVTKAKERFAVPITHVVVDLRRALVRFDATHRDGPDLRRGQLV
jgi:hypothetical protein